jgi:hypothetical protein
MLLPHPSRLRPAPVSPRRFVSKRQGRRLLLEPLERRDLPAGWHNDALPADVNGDNEVSAADALAVINYLNSGGEPTLPPTDQQPWTWLDVSNDGYATSLDALLVVNKLNFDQPQYLLSSDNGNPPLELSYIADPTGLTLRSDASDRIIAHWTGAPGAAGTRVSIQEAASPPAASPGGIVTAASSFVFTDLKPNTRYFIRVSSINELGLASAGIAESIVTRQSETINTHQLARALTAGIAHLGHLRDRDNSRLPYFFAWSLSRSQAARYGDRFRGRDSTAHLKFDRHFVSNVAGRALYAVLHAARSLGIEPPADVVADYARILLKALHKPRDRNWVNTSPENQLLVGLVSDPSSYRSQKFDVTYLFNVGQGFRGMLALAAMMPNADALTAAYGRTAREIFETSVYNLRKYYVYQGEIGGSRVYDWEQFRRQLDLRGGLTIGKRLSQELSRNWTGYWANYADPHLIYPLVKYFEATGHQGSLDLAQELADLAFAGRFPADPAAVGASLLPHMFETVAEMNAYSRLALITGNAEMMQRVRLRYEYLRDSGIISKTGWVPEWLGRGHDIGEANNTAELVETALNFGQWGWTEYYQDVERFTRGHLLPSQLLETSFISNDPRNRVDGRRNVREKMVGAFGFPAPYGHISTNYTYGRAGAYFADITAGAVATLATVCEQVYARRGGDHVVHLLFDYENDHVQVASPYPGGNRLVVTAKTAGDLLVRIPRWADRTLIEQAMAEQGAAMQWEGDYLRISQPATGVPLSIPLPLSVVREVDVVNRREIKIEWAGDSVRAMSSMGTPQPFFPAI